MDYFFTSPVRSDQTSSMMHLTTVFQHFKITFINPRGVLYYSWIHTVVTWNTSDTADWILMKLGGMMHLSNTSWHVQNYTEVFQSQSKQSVIFVTERPRDGLHHLWGGGGGRVYCCLVLCGTNQMQALVPWRQQLLAYSQLSRSS